MCTARLEVVLYLYNIMIVLQNDRVSPYLRMILNRHEHFFGNGDGRAVRFRQHERFFLHAVHFEQAGPDFGYFCNNENHMIYHKTAINIRATHVNYNRTSVQWL